MKKIQKIRSNLQFLITFFFNFNFLFLLLHVLYVQKFTDGEPNFPSVVQEQCLVIIRHLQSLRYEDVPDYDLIDTAFAKTVQNVRNDMSRASDT